MLDDSVFQNLYKNLNKSQKEAVDTVEGPVMVIAGPGTGKTTILTLRIANILKATDTDPSSILALTFTESGVRTMRKKLLDIIGPDSYKIGIYTFHGFCNDVINEYPEEFPYIIGSTNATEVDQIKIIEDTIDGGEFEYIKPYGDPYYYVYPILSQIRNVKREGYTPESFSDLLQKRKNDFKEIPDLYHEKGRYKGEMKGEYRKVKKLLDRDKEFLIVFKKYQESLRLQKKIDFEDMIIEVVKVLEENKDLLLTLQERYQYILADEHQDANKAQNTILELLANFHESPNLFVVGDEKQAIFRFQGASLENFLYFQRLYKDTKLIHLEDNYRSTQNILDNADQLISNNNVDQKLRTSLKSNSSFAENPVAVYPFNKESEELFFVLEDIKKKISSGVSPNEIAIIYRNNKDSFDIVRKLEKTEIPFVVFSDQDILDHVDIRRMLTLMHAVQTISDDVHIAEAMHISYLGIDPIDIYTILDFSRKNKRKIFDVMANSLSDMDLRDVDAVTNFTNLLQKWSIDSRNKDALSMFEDILNESGYLNNILKNPSTYERLNILETFFSEIKSVAANHNHFSLKEFLDHVAILKQYSISIKAKNLNHRDGIRLMTAHRSKGLEFEYVYIIDAIQKKWGKSSRGKLFTEINGDNETNQEDERRLFYVALTRAKKEITITYSKTKDDGTESLPTQFIGELREDLVEFHDEQSFSVEDLYSKSIGIKNDKAPSLHDKEYLNRRFLDQPLSVTALNNYLECPWNYFYTNLIRIPKTYSKHQIYGTVVHDALKDLYDSISNGDDLKREDFLGRFDHYLKHQLLDENTEKELRTKGEDSLGGYFDFYYKSFKKPLETEYKVFADFDLGQGNKIVLTGNLDKIEKEGDVVSVVDYKTSKIKSKNEILGKTKNSNGNIFRQLVFYKLLLDYSDDNYKMKNGIIDFIEPDNKGNYKKEIFEITNDDVENLVSEIKKASDEILSLSFWKNRCDNSECEFCKLNDSLNL